MEHNFDSLDKVILGMYGYTISKNIKTLLEFMCTKAIDRLFSFHLADLRIFGTQSEPFAEKL